MEEAEKPGWVIAGWISFAVGIIALAIPVVPTVPFMIVAAFCFSRGSPRLHSWIIHHPKFGKPILEWEQHGLIRSRTKIITTVLIAGSCVSSFLIFPVPRPVKIALAVIFPLVLIFVWSRPSEPRQE
jgi:uncharacterized membrane protein YbaN (DUF454 family)